MCSPRRCQSCHRTGRTSCRCDAWRRVWGGNPFCRWTQTEPCSAAWGSLGGKNTQTETQTRIICATCLQPSGAAGMQMCSRGLRSTKRCSTDLLWWQERNSLWGLNHFFKCQTVVHTVQGQIFLKISADETDGFRIFNLWINSSYSLTKLDKHMNALYQL